MSTRLERRDAANVLEVHEQVVAERIGDVVNQVLHRAFTRHHGLRAAREARHHRKTAVLDFLDTHLPKTFENQIVFAVDLGADLNLSSNLPKRSVAFLTTLSNRCAKIFLG